MSFASAIANPLDRPTALLASRMARIFAALLSLLLSVTIIEAQTNAAGQVNGTVLDPAGAPVAKAEIVLQNTGTGVEQRATSNESGQYRILNVLPGSYTLSVSMSGFKTVNIQAFHIDVNQNVTHDIHLELGEVSQQVSVQAQADLIQRASTELGTVVERQAILDLPLNSRNFLQLLDLTPGASSPTPGSTATSVNGQWTANNVYQLDGANNTTVIGGTAGIVPILDTLDEFKVQSHNDQAEYGGFLGADVNVVSRSGTNQLHGSAWEFVRNSDFNARNPFTNSTTGVSPFRQNRYGATFGGPVVIPKIYNGRDRTFFFFGYEGYKNRQQSQSLVRVPNSQELSGDFSAHGEPVIYDPVTGAPFASNIIPSNRISPTALAYMKIAFDQPNYTGSSFYNRLNLFPNPTDSNQYSIKIDQNVGSKDSFWGRYTQYDITTTTYQSASIFLPQNTHDKNLGVSWNHSFSPSVILESRFSWIQLFTNFTNQLQGGNQPLLQAGFSASQIAAFGLPDFDLTSPWYSPYVAGVGVNNSSNPLVLEEGLNWLHGKHAFKFGFQIIREGFQNVGRGQHYAFSNAQTGNPVQIGSTGGSLASALLGLPSSVSDTEGVYNEELNIWGAYLQDTWKLNPKLTLNLGVRYDQYPTPDFTQGMISEFDMSTGYWLIGAGKLPPPCNSAGVAPCIPGNGLSDVPYGDKIRLAQNPGILHPIRDNFGPRVGIAYSVNDKTVLRLGWGIYYDTTGATAQEAQNPSNNWPSANGVSETLNQPGEPLTTVQQLAGQNVSVLPPPSPWKTNGYQWYPNKRNARSQQYHIDLQRQLRQNLMMSVAYVGNVSDRLDMTVAQNIAISPGPGTPAQISVLRPYPYMTPMIYGTNWGIGNYNALQVKLDKRFSSGFQGLVAYTYSKAMDNGTSSWFATSGVQDSYHTGTSYGPSSYDRTQVLVMSGTWELPFGSAKRWLNSNPVKWVLGGWQFSAIATLESGTPLNLTVPGDVANVGATFLTYERPNLIGDPYVAHPGEKAWFNPAAFTSPVLAYGNFGRDVLRGPAFYNADLSLLRNIHIRERLTAQLRFESFNTFNLMNLGSPATSVGSGNLGQITSIQGSPRNLQFGLKLSF